MRDRGGNRRKAEQKAPPSWLHLCLWKLAVSQTSPSYIPVRLLRTDGLDCSGDGLTDVVTAA